MLTLRLTLSLLHSRTSGGGQKRDQRDNPACVRTDIPKCIRVFLCVHWPSSLSSLSFPLCYSFSRSSPWLFCSSLAWTLVYKSSIAPLLFFPRLCSSLQIHTHLPPAFFLLSLLLPLLHPPPLPPPTYHPPHHPIASHTHN